MVCGLAFLRYYTTQTLIRAKIVILFAVSDTKNFDRYVAQLSLYKHVSFCSCFLQIVLAEVQKAPTNPPPPHIKLQLCMVASFSNFVICPLSTVHHTAEMHS